jgi:hypothetical protein
VVGERADLLVYLLIIVHCGAAGDERVVIDSLLFTERESNLLSGKDSTCIDR